VQHLHDGAFISRRYNPFLMCSVQQGASIDPLILEGIKALPPRIDPLRVLKIAPLASVKGARI
jgi:hypothetical protein